jgi:hypothetical protein
MTDRKSYLSSDGTEYSITDPDKVALLQCLGAEIIRRDASNPNKIIFTLKHKRIAEFVDAIHSGNLGQYGADPIVKFSKYRKAIMDFINEVRLNRRG